jgi:hypothetical protein
MARTLVVLAERYPLVACWQREQPKEIRMGRNVSISLGALILIIIVVAIIF